MYLVKVNVIGLIVSLATVKWDSSRIYGKLGVENPVVKARELGIIEQCQIIDVNAQNWHQVL